MLWKIKVDKEGVEQTSLISHNGLHQFMKIPFGLKRTSYVSTRDGRNIVSGQADIRFCVRKWHIYILRDAERPYKKIYAQYFVF